MTPPAAATSGHTPLRVCFVTLQARGAFIPSPGAKIGGAEQQIAHLARGLAAMGDFETHVIVEDQGQPDRETVDGVSLWRLRQPRDRRFFLARLYRKCVSGKRLMDLARSIGADVYVQMCAGAETGLTAIAAGRAGGAFVYMMASDLELLPPWTDGKSQAGYFFQHGLKRASAIIAQNEHQRTGMQSLYGHNAILIRSIYPFPPDAAPGADGILWVGRCKQVKSPERFLDLAAALPDVRFTMVALPTAEEPEFFASLAERAAALPNLEWVPGATTAEMPAIYGRHAVLVNTSDHEGVPNTFIEAAAHGLAIVSLSVDPDAILSKENAGICCGGDRTRLIEAVRRLATDRAQCRQMGSRARTVFRRLYDAENVLPAYAELIRHLAAGARVNRA